MFSTLLPTITQEGTRVGPVSSFESPAANPGARGASCGAFGTGLGRGRLPIFKGGKLLLKGLLLFAIPGTYSGLPSDGAGLFCDVFPGGAGTLMVAGRFGSPD